MKQKKEWWHKYLVDPADLVTGWCVPVAVDGLESLLAEQRRRTQIETFEWLLKNASGGGDWRRVAEQKMAECKKTWDV